MSRVSEATASKADSWVVQGQLVCGGARSTGGGHRKRSAAPSQAQPSMQRQQSSSNSDQEDLSHECFTFS